MKSTPGAEIEPEGNFHDGLDDSVNVACQIEKLELNLEISLTPESDQYRKIQRRESKCEWNGNIWKNKYKGNIVELNRAV